MGCEVAFFIARYGDGGVENMLVRLACGLARRQSGGIDFLAPSGRLPYLDQLPESVRVVRFEREAVPAQLRAYLSRVQPQRLVTGKPEDERLATVACAAAPAPVRLYCRIGVPQLHRLRMRRRNPLKRWWTKHTLARSYRYVHGFLAVSRRTAAELVDELRVPAKRVHVLPNPVVDRAMLRAARAPCPHEWLAPGGTPVLVGSGGLRRQKDFTTLVEAFAALRAHRPARLLILGEGRQRGRLRRLAQNLGVAEDFDLPGFCANPYSYVSRASVFVLSSLWEGQPNVLIEAMALGVPVVATDCVSGPREILDNARHGALVGVGDPIGLARAIGETLDEPPMKRALRRAVRNYTAAASIEAYAHALGMPASGAEL